jgi:5-aminopentanamidase
MTVIAAAQLAIAVGDPDANLAAAAGAVAAAASSGARLVVLPELSDSGYVFTGEPEARSLATPADGRTLACWRRLAAEHRVVIAGG